MGVPKAALLPARQQWIDTAIFDFDADRVHAIHATLSKAVPAGNDQKVTLSLLDMFDLERISLLAEGELQAFAGTEKTRLMQNEMVSLTSPLEHIRAQAFPPEPTQGSKPA